MIAHTMQCICCRTKGDISTEKENSALMFKFSFFDDTSLECDDEASTNKAAACTGSNRLLHVFVDFEDSVKSWPAQELFRGCDGASPAIDLVQLVAPGTSGTANGTDLSHIVNHLDVKPGLYEGGFKTWECTKDVIAYICAPAHQLQAGSTVFDMGCGPGLAGCAALKQGCSVLFQDLNADVLRSSTSAHVQANCGADDISQRVCLLAGPWTRQAEFLHQAALDKQLPNWAVRGKFSYILSSETLYREEYFAQFTCAMLGSMSAQSIAIIGTKRFYFGVGGGTRRWLGHLEHTFGCSAPVATPSAGGCDAAALELEAEACERAAGGSINTLYTSAPLSSEHLAAFHAEELGGRRLCVVRVAAIADGSSNVRDVLRVSTVE
jgi:hypothetical protein